MTGNTHNALHPRDEWLARDHPELYHILHAIEGDAAALDWLQRKSRDLFLFTRALLGDRSSLEALTTEKPLELDDLFIMFSTDEFSPVLTERHPELHLLFEAIKGDDMALRRLRRKRAAMARAAEVVGPLYRDFLEKDLDEPVAEDDSDLANGAAADVGCLVGEMHLDRGDYEKAIEAFSRAIETNPSADEFEGRARAYRALAQRDERRAAELRGQACATPASPKKG